MTALRVAERYRVSLTNSPFKDARIDTSTVPLGGQDIQDFKDGISVLVAGKDLSETRNQQASQIDIFSTLADSLENGLKQVESTIKGWIASIETADTETDRVSDLKSKQTLTASLVARMTDIKQQVADIKKLDEEIVISENDPFGQGSRSINDIAWDRVNKVTKLHEDLENLHGELVAQYNDGVKRLNNLTIIEEFINQLQGGSDQQGYEQRFPVEVTRRNFEREIQALGLPFDPTQPAETKTAFDKLRNETQAEVQLLDVQINTHFDTAVSDLGGIYEKSFETLVSNNPEKAKEHIQTQLTAKEEAVQKAEEAWKQYKIDLQDKEAADAYAELESLEDLHLNYANIRTFIINNLVPQYKVLIDPAKSLADKKAAIIAIRKLSDPNGFKLDRENIDKYDYSQDPTSAELSAIVKNIKAAIVRCARPGATEFDKTESYLTDSEASTMAPIFQISQEELQQTKPELIEAKDRYIEATTARDKALELKKVIEIKKTELAKVQQEKANADNIKAKLKEYDDVPDGTDKAAQQDAIKKQVEGLIQANFQNEIVWADDTDHAKGINFEETRKAFADGSELMKQYDESVDGSKLKVVVDELAQAKGEFEKDPMVVAYRELERAKLEAEFAGGIARLFDISNDFNPNNPQDIQNLKDAMTMLEHELDRVKTATGTQTPDPTTVKKDEDKNLLDRLNDLKTKVDNMTKQQPFLAVGIGAALSVIISVLISKLMSGSSSVTTTYSGAQQGSATVTTSRS